MPIPHFVTKAGGGFPLPLVLVLAAAAASPAAHAELPETFTAQYTLSVNGLHVAHMTRALRRIDADLHVFSSRTRAAGIAKLFRGDRVEEESRWRPDGAKVEPVQYRYSQTGGRKQREVTVRFDELSGRIATTVNDQTWHMDMVPGVLDKLVYQLVLMIDLAAGERTLEYRIADGGRIKIYHLEVTGTEHLRTPAGEFDAIRIVRRKSNSARETVIWCAPRLHFLPVRVDYREKNGDLTSAVLESQDGLGPS
ncbi:MAG: DUF3108 domain-containing protein [Gammaproteobacteria bacterium]|nr:DUF3108 domain-containing protein [Gammaproteobacteria bacterium]